MYICIIWHVSSMYPGGLAYRREHRIGDIPIIGISSIITVITNIIATTFTTTIPCPRGPHLIGGLRLRGG